MAFRCQSNASIHTWRFGMGPIAVLWLLTVTLLACTVFCWISAAKLRTPLQNIVGKTLIICHVVIWHIYNAMSVFKWHSNTITIHKYFQYTKYRLENKKNKNKHFSDIHNKTHIYYQIILTISSNSLTTLILPNLCRESWICAKLLSNIYFGTTACPFMRKYLSNLKIQILHSPIHGHIGRVGHTAIIIGIAQPRIITAHT